MSRISTPRADILPAFLFAAVPLVFLAAISLYQLFGNVPDARSAREDTKTRFLSCAPQALSPTQSRVRSAASEVI